MNEIITTELSEDLMAKSISQQYDDIQTSAGQLVRKIINFGCALAEAERLLDARGLLKNRKGQGFLGWLADNCPTVNYKTAQRWKTVAVQVSNSLDCTPPEALEILSGGSELPAKVAKRRDEILGVESIRKLSAMLFNYASEDHGAVGRPAGSKSTGEKLTRTESARRLWAGVLCVVARNREGLYKAATLLPIDEARAGLAELKALVSALDRRCKEGR